MRNIREMCAKWALSIYLILEGENEMMAMLFAQRIILSKKKDDGTPTTFADVPEKLKARVADILINECGLPELVPTEFGGTAE